MPDTSGHGAANARFAAALWIDADRDAGGGSSNKAQVVCSPRGRKPVVRKVTEDGIPVSCHWPLTRRSNPSSYMRPSVAVLSSGLPAPLTSARSLGLAQAEHDVPNTDDEICVFNKFPGRQQSFQGAQHRSFTVGCVSHGFNGVRQRKGVRGFLVEIRPPKWKKTIWLGTYNTAEEAGSAYDAGIFYTGKKKKYNFPELQGTFPPLPSPLRFESADDQDKIKTFVQQQARDAARHVKICRMKGESTNLCQFQHMEKLKICKIKTETEPPDVAATTTAPVVEEASSVKLEGVTPTTAPVAEGASYVNLEGVAPTTAPDASDASYFNLEEVTPRGNCSNSNEATQFFVPPAFQHLFDGYESVGEDRSGNFQWPPHVQATVSRSRDSQPESNSKYAVGRKRSCDAIDEDGLMSRLAPSIRKQVEDPIKHDRSVNTNGDRPINDDDLISRLAPSIRKWVEEALSSTLCPLLSALRSREEEEQKHREKLLALETQKLALKRAKLLLGRRRVAQCQPHPRASSLLGNRVKKNPTTC